MKTTHLSRLVPEKAALDGRRTVLRIRNYENGSWSETTWSDLDRDVTRIAKALIGQSILEKDRVGIFSLNRPECIVAEYAIYSVRGVSVPVYASNTTVQLEYIINDSGMNVLFVGDQYQYDRAFEAQQSCKVLKQIVIFNPDVRLAVTDVTSMYFADYLQAGLLSKDDKVLEDRRLNAQDDDMANIVYTSGTSGEPKGVILTHEMFLEAIRANDKKITALGKNDVSLSFLPFSHILEKSWSHFCLQKGIRIDINTRPTDIRQTLYASAPNCMCSVPRFWEKLYERIQDKVNAKPALYRRFFDAAIQLGRTYHVDLKRRRKPVPMLTALQYHFYDQVLFKGMRESMGLQNAVFLPVAGARLSNDLLLFFRSMGIPLYHGYGLTESTATVAVFDEYDYRVGSVGTVLDGLDVKISPEGEILLKGKTVTPGYYRKPDETAACLTEDGYFRTGDAGTLDEGHLVVTERIKDLYKTSNGKYIAPQKLETALRDDLFINMAAVIGNELKYVTALIVPNYERLPEICKTLGFEYTTLAEVLADERVYNFYRQRIRQIQKHMADYEQIRRFILLAEPFTVANGRLTDTLKLRRKAIAEDYYRQIAKMY